MQHSIQRTSLLVAALLIAAGAACGQDKPSSLQATARADRPNIQLGQSAAIVVEVKGTDARPQITIPTSEDCYITLAGKYLPSPLSAGLGRNALLPSTSFAGSGLSDSLQKLTEKLANDPLLDPGAMKGLGAPSRDENALVYHVHAKHAGAIVVPPFTVNANGETVTTKPIELHVSPARSQDYVRLVVSLSNPRPMVGQEVRLNVDVLVRREQVRYLNQTYPHLPLKAVHLSLPPLDIGPMELVKPLGEVVKEHAPPAGHHGYKINHLPGEVVFDKEASESKDELGWYRRRLEIPVRLKQAGKVSIQAAGVAGDVFVSAAGGSRRTAGRWTQFAATSESLDVEVRDLPANRPRDFSGNMGELRVTTSASQTKMQTGTPFTLTTRLEGQGYLPRAGSLNLAASPEFTHRFRVHADADRAVSDTVREVTYQLRPLSADVKEVPAVAVTYFDSRTDEFKTVKSAAIPLDVSGPPISPDPASESATEESERDLPLLEDLDAAHKRGFLTRNLIPIAALLAAITLVAGVLIGGRLRRWRAQQPSRAAEQQRQQAAGEVCRQLTSRVQSVHEVRELVQKVLRARFGLPAGEITPHDAAERLRQAGVRDDLASESAELLESCAAAEFAPGVNPVSLPELIARAERLTTQLTNASPKSLIGAVTSTSQA
jgi:hypothetical protein